MVDPGNHQAVRVQVAELGPYINLTVNALNRVRQLLQDNGISFWVDPHAVSIDRQPATTWIWIHKKTDPVLVQGILDSAA